MEIEGEDGSKISIKPDSKTEFGRGVCSSANDLTVSRRHISFEPQNSESRVSFQVLGKNPIWVYRRENGNTEVFRRSEKGEIQIGDSFCVSANKPVLFKLKKTGEEEKKRDISLVEEEISDVVQSGVEESEVVEELGLDSSVDVSDIDPVKEFGFLVIGHEFDSYPKTRIRAINNWNWFLEESRVDSDSDEYSETTRSKGKKNIRRKRKGEGNDDEEWTGESDEDKDVISKVRKGKKPRYTTRSKDVNKSLVGIQSRKKSKQNKINKGIDKDEEEEEEEDDDDNDNDDEETLGGFIVSDEEDEDEEEEEEEEIEDEDEDDDD